MDRFRPPRTHRIDQHLQEVGAEDRDVGKSVALDRLGAEIEQFPGPAGIPQADLLALGIAGELTQLIQYAERVQGAGAVRADLHAGAKFLEFRRLLVNVDVMAAVDQSERGRHAADTAAGDEDVVGHDGMLEPADAGLARRGSRCVPGFRSICLADLSSTSVSVKIWERTIVWLSVKCGR